MMTVAQLIEALYDVQRIVGPDTQVVLKVHDGPVDREVSPNGLWYDLPIEGISRVLELEDEFHGAIEIVAEA